MITEATNSFNLSFNNEVHELFTDYQGKEYISHTREAITRTFEIGSSSFHRYAKYLCYQEFGKIPDMKGFKEAIEILKMKAYHLGIKKSPAYRLGASENGNGFEMDLGDSTYRVMKVDEEGVRIIQPTVPFLRNPLMEAIAQPESGNGFEELWELLSISNDDKKLVIAWLLSALRPTAPYFILVLLGEQGSAKSTTAKALAYLIDPSEVPLSSFSKTERDLVIALNQSRVVSFDNISNIDDKMSDALCRASVGGGFKTRKLYSDDTQIVFKPQNPMILNGISNLCDRQDLISRSIVIHLPTIQQGARITEGDFFSRLEAMRPRILDHLLKATSVAIREYPNLTHNPNSRMADCEKWVAAAETYLGWEPGTTVNILANNQVKAIELGLESEPLSEAIIGFMTSRNRWDGTATQLLGQLETESAELKELKNWPKAGNSLSSKLKRLVTALRLTTSISIDFQREAGTGQRKIVIHKLSE
jgi:putative DNA primase/helicase